MPPRAVRLIDIAHATGVHPSVVSRALRGDPRLSIRPETLERIRATAVTMGYRVNTVARALRASTVGAAAIVVPSLRNPVWEGIVRGALTEAVRRNTAVLLAEVPDDVGSDAEYVRLVEEGRIDGLLIASSEPKERRGEWPPTGVPCVHVNRAAPGAPCNIIMDERKATDLLISHFQARGHTRIAVLEGPESIDTTQRRIEALRTIAEDRELFVTVTNQPYDEAGGYKGVRELFDLSSPRPTAIAIASLSQLIGGLAALHSLESISAGVDVACFDDDPIIDYLPGHIASVRMPMYELGEAAMRALLDRVAGAKPKSLVLDSPMELILR